MFRSYFARNFAKPGKPAPLYHIIIGAFLLGYSLEYPHIRHEIMEETRKAAAKLPAPAHH